MNIDEMKRGDAGDLCRLAFLLKGRRDVSIHIGMESVVSQDGANSFFAAWMRAGARMKRYRNGPRSDS